MSNFTPYPQLIQAQFLSRPNRFVVRILIEGKEYGASMGNPGRMQELLFRDTTLLVIKMDTSKVTYPYRVVGVLSDAGPLLLDTIKTNNVAHWLIENRCVPSLLDYHVVRAEVTVGKSRFDLLLANDSGEQLYCEVKSCSLIAHQRAMFPDAVTSRGARHTQELGDMARSGIKTAILFIVQSSQATSFVPDFHNDPFFAQTLYNQRNDVAIIPLSIQWDAQLSLSSTTKELPIDWNLYEKEGKTDGGGLFFMVEIKEDTPRFQKGFYCALSGEEKQLSKHVTFLRGKRKGMKSTIEHIRAVGTVVGDWPIRRGDISLLDMCTNLEQKCGVVPIQEPLSSDEHIYYFEHNPVRTRPFQQVILSYRMSF